MTTPEQNFWRLFADYEDLTRHQTTAIGEDNFAVLGPLHERKTVILKELASIAAFLGLHRDHPALKDRLAAVTDMAWRNTTLMSKKIAESRRESRLLDAAACRLRAVEHVYLSDAHAGALRAHG